MVKTLIEHGADINESHIENGTTPLIIAASNGHMDIVKLLVEHGTNVNKSNHKGVTPLLMAVKNHHNNIVIYLVEHGAKTDKSAKNGISPLNIAKKNNDPVMTCLLHKWKFNGTPARMKMETVYMDGI